MKKIKYNWGIIGLGNIAHKFAEALASTEKGNLLAVGSRTIEKAEKFASTFGANRWYGSYDQLINDSEIDIVYIATPHNLHYELTRKCLLHNKHVLCEKPITINSIQFENLKRLAIERQLFLMDAIWTRFLPHIQRIIELIQKGEIGEIKHMRADFGFKANFNPQGRLFNPKLGGGAILDIGIYPIFLSLLVMGYPESIRVIAQKGQTGVDESTSMIFLYKEGKIAQLACTFNVNTSTSAEINGTKGRISIHSGFFAPVPFTIITENNTSLHEFPIQCNGYEYEAEEVMTCLDQGKTQSDLHSLDFTSSLMKLLDEVRKKASVFYKEDYKEIME